MTPDSKTNFSHAGIFAPSVSPEPVLLRPNTVADRQPVDALRLFENLLASGSYEQAADLLGEQYEAILSAGKYAQVDALLKRFPEAMTQQHPWLLLARARLHGTQQDTTGAEPLYKQAESRSRSAEDQQAIFVSLREFGDWLSRQSRFTESVVSYRRALVFADSESERATVLAPLALSIYMEQGYSSEVEHLMSQALDLTDKADMLQTMGRVLHAQAALHSMRGNFENALVSYGTIEKLMERRYSEKMQAEVLHNIAYIHALCGEWEKAEQLAYKGATLLETDQQKSDETGLAYSFLLRGIIGIGRRRFPLAAEMLAQALSLYQEQNNRVKTALTLDWLSDLAGRSGEWDEALRHAERGLELRRALGLSYELGLSYITLGKALLGAEQPERARSYMSRALEIAYTGDAKYQQAQAHLYLAALESQNDSLTSQRFSFHYHAQQALSLSRRNNYATLFVSNGVLPVQVLSEALAEGIEAEYAAGLLSKAAILDEPGVLALLNGLSGSTSPAVKRARAAAIRAWSDSPAEPIHIQTLGNFTVTRADGSVVQWLRSSSKTVLQYLLLHHIRAVPIEELVEVLWPASELAPARKNLHQAVAGLRHGLEPDIPAGFPSRYVQSAYEAYRFVLPPRSTVDNVHFSQQCTHLKTLTDLEKAASLYTGDFLADNPYADWAMPRRSQFSERYRDILLRLTSAYFSAGRVTDCLTSAQRLLEHDPWNEDAVLWLMKASAARGDRASALRAFKSIQKRLREDFDIDPRSDILQFYQEILHL